MMSSGPSAPPRYALRAFLGSAQDDNWLGITGNLDYWQLATGNWELILWRIKKDKAPHETGATRTRSGLGLRLSADNWCPAARSSCGSGGRGGSPDGTLDAARTTLSSPRSRDA